MEKPVFPEGEGAPNMQDMLVQVQRMQEQYVALQQELVEAEVSASAGGGLVTATVSGTGEFKRVNIDPKAVDPEDVETLEDLVSAAISAAGEEARKLAEEKLGPITESLSSMGGGGLGLPGM